MILENEDRKPGTGAFYSNQGLAFVLIFVFLFNILFHFVALYLAALVFRHDFTSIKNLLIQPDGSALAINLSRFVSTVEIIGSMFLPAYLFSIINQTGVKQEGKLGQPVKLQWIFLSILIIALAAPLAESFTQLYHNFPWPQKVIYWADRFENSRQALIGTILDMHALPELFVCLLLLGLVPAFFEELMFRGVIMNIFKKITGRKWLSVVLQALVFAVLHFSFYEFPAIFFTGVLFGWVAWMTGTIWYGIVMHFIFNGTTIFIEYLNKMEFDKTGINGKYQLVHFTPLLIVAGVLAIVLLLRLFQKNVAESLKNA